jgi:hypothetical protein
MDEAVKLAAAAEALLVMDASLQVDPGAGLVFEADAASNLGAASGTPGPSLRL